MTSILAALLLIAGLSALPTSSLARPAAPASHRAVDDPSQTDQGGEVDDQSTDESADLSDEDLAALDATGDSCDSAGILPADDSSGDGTDDPSGDATDDPSADDTAADARQAPADSGTDDTAADDTGDDPTADDQSGDPASGDQGDDPGVVDCAAELTDEEALDDVGDDDVQNLSENGSFTQTYDMPEGGTIDETLTGGSSGRAVIAKAKVLGKARKKVAKAGRVTVRIKLTRQGRKALRTARRALKLTLSTRISLKSGRTIKRTKALTVKPSKKAPARRGPAKGKHKKPGKKPKP